MKAEGLFGEGKWKSVGAKLRADENPFEGAVREVLEETGLVVSNLKPHGVLSFYFGQKIEADWVVYVFSTNAFKGRLKSSEEGTLRWFAFDEIPYHDMWEDDKYWLPFLLKGKRLHGDFYFNKEGTKLEEFNLQIDS